MEAAPEQRHKTLIEAIKKKKQVLGLRPQTRKQMGSGDWANLDTNEINDVVVLIATYLNLTGGSIGEFNLYELLQCYFQDEQARTEINRCVSESLSRNQKKILDD